MNFIPSLGLIRGAIVESGSAFSPGVFSYSDSQTDISKQAAIKFGCATAAQWDQHNTGLMTQMLQVSKCFILTRTTAPTRSGLTKYIFTFLIEARL